MRKDKWKTPKWPDDYNILQEAATEIVELFGNLICTVLSFAC
jgi:hypothetical protein